MGQSPTILCGVVLPEIQVEIATKKRKSRLMEFGWNERTPDDEERYPSATKINILFVLKPVY